MAGPANKEPEADIRPDGIKRKLRLVSIDLDGTLLDSTSKISGTNKKAIKRCLDRGISIIITTAKSVYWVRGLIRSLGLKDPQISASGAAILDGKGKLISVTKIPRDSLIKTIKLSRDKSIPVGISCADGLIYFEKDYPELVHIWETYEPPKKTEDLLDDSVLDQALLVSFTIDKEHQANKMITELLIGELEVKRAGNHFLNCHSKKASKLIALKQIAKGLKIPKEDILALGDSESDIEILDFAGMGVAMGNSTDDVKEMANAIVSDNDNDGVAEAIDKFVLGPF